LLIGYNQPMKITFDLLKDLINQQKHGISLADAALLDWNAIQVEVDEREVLRYELKVNS